MTSKEPSSAEEIRKKIELATQAVSAISDQSLKGVAFKVVLERLLASDDEETRGKETARPPQPKPTPPAKRPKGPKGRIEELVAEGVFHQKKALNEVKQELAARGWHHTIQELNPSLLRLVKEKKLRRIKEPTKKGGKLVWRYSEW